MAQPPTTSPTPIHDELLAELRAGGIRETGRHHIIDTPPPAHPHPQGWFETTDTPKPETAHNRSAPGEHLDTPD